MINNRVYVFDLDDTLIDTQAKVRILDVNGKVIDRLGTQFHNDNVYEKNTLIDYSEFEDLDQLLVEPELPAMRCLEQCLKDDPWHTYILSARQRNDVIAKWLELKGLNTFLYENIQPVNFGIYKTMQKGKPAYINKWLDEKLLNTAELVRAIKEFNMDQPERFKLFVWEDNAATIKAIREMVDSREGEEKPVLYINASLATLNSIKRW